MKVVILGQDPYHGPRQAHGLAFSVPHGIQAPPSLHNIFQELHRDLDVAIPQHGCLESWAQQGVLLLNSVLTVESGKPQSHANIGWQEFTDTVIRSLNRHQHSIVFLLWGAYAQRKADLINNQHHLILTAPHPSPLSAHRGFISCGHFSKTNQHLLSTGQTAIQWAL